MTVLGKMMVFLVMLLSFVWCGLVVNAFVTRTNWKNEADFYKKQAQESAQAAETMKQQLIAQRNAHTSESQALVASNVQQAQQIREGSDRALQIKTNYDKLINDFRSQEAQTSTWKANLDLLESQVKTLTEANDTSKRRIDALVLEATDARIARDQARIDSRDQKLRADQLAERLQVAREQAGDSGSGRSTSIGTSSPEPLPQNWSGTVQKYYPTDNYVELTPGLDSQLDSNHSLIVSRGNKYIGTIKVIQADAKSAVGRFTPANANARASEENVPQSGDVLTPNR